MMTRSRTHAVGLTLTFFAATLTSACDGSEPAPPSPTTSTPTASTSSPTSSTRTTTTLTPAERDVRSAEAAIGRYWGVLDQLAADPTKSLNLVATVARDQAALQARNTLGTYQAKGWTLTGRTSVTSPIASTKDGKTFSVSACVDVEKVNIVDKTGKSVVRAGRPDRQRYAYTVVKAPQGFFVTVDTLKGNPC